MKFLIAGQQQSFGASQVYAMPHLQSSVMTFVKYDDDGCELDITFTSGKTYRYLEVPVEIYEGLLDAESKGEFFNDNIKHEFNFAEVRSSIKRR